MAKTALRVLEGGGGDSGGAASGEPEPIDPIVEECLQDALGPYLGLLSPEEVLEHRQFLTMFLTTHPQARLTYERLAAGRRKRAPVARSGDVAKDGVLLADDELDGTSGGRGSR